MSFLKKPFRKLTGSINKGEGNINEPQDKAEGFDTPTTATTSSLSNGKRVIDAGTPNGSATPTDDKRRSREVLREDRVRKSMDKERSKAEERKRQAMRRIESEAFMREAPPELTKLYKPYSMNMSKRWNHENRVLFKDLDFESESRPTEMSHAMEQPPGHKLT
jgi:aspartyl-tRNA synthetase